MRANTESGNVVSSHASACGASSLTTNAWIDSRSASCSSLKMKCRRGAAWSGLRTSVAAIAGAYALRIGSDAMELNTVRFDVQDAIATIAMDRPQARNALSDELLDDLLAAFAAARADAEVRCVVLTSTHEKVFSAGGDLGGFTADAPLVHKHVASE